jgi:hypothetical protein
MSLHTLVRTQKQLPQRASFTTERRQCAPFSATGQTIHVPARTFDLCRIPVHRAADAPSAESGNAGLSGSSGALRSKRPDTGTAHSGSASESSESTDPIATSDAGPAERTSDEPSAEPQSGNLPGAPGACLIQAALPYSRSGIRRSSTGTVGEVFQVRAAWRSDPAVSRGKSSYCAAECGEYRQFIRGHMLSSANKDGSNATDVSAKIFGGKRLDENVFREDGLDRNPKARYGHRNEPQTMTEKYEPDRASGPKYTGDDFPNVSIGTFADIDLTFLGQLVDTCNKTVTMSDTWQVQYRGVIRP